MGDGDASASPSNSPIGSSCFFIVSDVALNAQSQESIERDRALPVWSAGQARLVLVDVSSGTSADKTVPSLAPLENRPSCSDCRKTPYSLPDPVG